MILGGEELLAIAAVQRQHRRLSSRRTRVRLVRNLEEIIEQETSHQKLQVRLVRPLFERRVVARVADDLRLIIGLLLADDAIARGVAGCERLITHACSPLYGQDVELLRRKVCRLRDMLGGGRC
jgi:hypothetical protein